MLESTLPGASARMAASTRRKGQGYHAPAHLPPDPGHLLAASPMPRPGRGRSHRRPDVTIRQGWRQNHHRVPREWFAFHQGHAEERQTVLPGACRRQRNSSRRPAEQFRLEIFSRYKSSPPLERPGTEPSPYGLDLKKIQGIAAGLARTNNFFISLEGGRIKSSPWWARSARRHRRSSSNCWAPRQTEACRCPL